MHLSKHGVDCDYITFMMFIGARLIHQGWVQGQKTNSPKERKLNQGRFLFLSYIEARRNTQRQGWFCSTECTGAQDAYGSLFCCPRLWPLSSWSGMAVVLQSSYLHCRYQGGGGNEQRNREYSLWGKVSRNYTSAQISLARTKSQGNFH